MVISIAGIDKGAALFALYRWARSSAIAKALEEVVVAEQELKQAESDVEQAEVAVNNAIKANAANLPELQDNVDRLKQLVIDAKAYVAIAQSCVDKPPPEIDEENAQRLAGLTGGLIEAIHFVYLGVNMRSDLVNTEKFDERWGERSALDALQPLGATEA